MEYQNSGPSGTLILMVLRFGSFKGVLFLVFRVLDVHSRGFSSFCLDILILDLSLYFPIDFRHVFRVTVRARWTKIHKHAIELYSLKVESYYSALSGNHMLLFAENFGYL